MSPAEFAGRTGGDRGSGVDELIGDDAGAGHKWIRRRLIGKFSPLGFDAKFRQLLQARVLRARGNYHGHHPHVVYLDVLIVFDELLEKKLNTSEFAIATNACADNDEMIGVKRELLASKIQGS